MEFNAQTLVSVLQIIWIDLLLSGDNAVVIALACRSLPPRKRRMGIVLGSGAAVALRILFALVITWLLGVPFLGAAGGLLLFWIAVKLITGEEEEAHVSESETLWQAVRTIVIADAVMSLDNVVAIAAAADGNVALFIFGLLVSIPLIVMGSTLLMALISRFPIFVWGGAALLGWIGGEMIVTDPWVKQALGPSADAWDKPVALLGAVLVVLIAFALRKAAARTARRG
ncbi:TerC family protein [Alsobacter ponti]|uniref:TerC family protein n=1 Tax=Alsobacter ponti TaxID=2962936 RepID=UPI003530992E